MSVRPQSGNSIFKDSPFSCLLIAFKPYGGNGTVLFNKENGTYLEQQQKQALLPSVALIL